MDSEVENNDITREMVRDSKVNIILQGDALTKLKELPDESIDCVMTSPPYWALRDYRVEGQLGLEETFQQYINKLCDIFDEVKRVLKKTGTCWVNIGDCYASGGGKAVEQSAKRQGAIDTGAYPDNPSKAKLRSSMPKCLIAIPQRFQIEMINRGWICRNTIIWHKPNCMPESVKDRFTNDFEYIFFFTKNKKYYFETQYEEALHKEDPRAGYGRLHYRGKRQGQKGTGQENFVKIVDKRNARAVWKISPKPYKEAHFAVYPEELCKRPLKAGCPVGGTVLDPFFGSGTTGLVALKQNKKFIGIELNKEYIEIAEKRLLPYMEQTQFP